MNKKITIESAIGIILLLTLIIGGAIYLSGRKATLNENSSIKKTEPKICTQEAKICPDGSYVSRTEPNCEFKACPEIKNENLPINNNENNNVKNTVQNNGVTAEVVKGEKFCSLDGYPDAGYQQILKIIFPDKKEKIIYTTEFSDRAKGDCGWLEGISGLNLSPDGKYLIFYKTGWESATPYLVNIDSGKYVFGDNSNIYSIREIKWSVDSKNFTLITDVNEMAGKGVLGIYTSEYNNPDKIRKIWSAEDYLKTDIKNLSFLENNKISFDTEIKGENQDIKISNYEYNFKENKLISIK